MHTDGVEAHLDYRKELTKGLSVSAVHSAGRKSTLAFHAPRLRSLCVRSKEQLAATAFRELRASSVASNAVHSHTTLRLMMEIDALRKVRDEHTLPLAAIISAALPPKAQTARMV